MKWYNANNIFRGTLIVLIAVGYSLLSAVITLTVTSWKMGWKSFLKEHSYFCTTAFSTKKSVVATIFLKSKFFLKSGFLKSRQYCTVLQPRKLYLPKMQVFYLILNKCYFRKDFNPIVAPTGLLCNKHFGKWGAMMTRYNARTTNPSKFLETKFNLNQEYQKR